MTFLARSLALHRTTEPQEALWHTYRWTDRQSQTQTHRQTDRHTDRQTHSHYWKHYLPTYVGGKKEKVHLSTYDTNVIQLGNTNNKMATPAPVQLQLPLTVSGLVFLCICLWTHVRDRIFKLIPIHASVIYQIPWIRWIQWKFRSI